LTDLHGITWQYTILILIFLNIYIEKHTLLWSSYGLDYQKEDAQLKLKRHLKLKLTVRDQFD